MKNGKSLESECIQLNLDGRVVDVHTGHYKAPTSGDIVGLCTVGGEQ